MNIWANEIAAFRAKRPWLSDLQVADAVAAAHSYVREETGVELSCTAPPSLQAAGFLFVLYAYENDLEGKRILRTNMATLIAPYRKGMQPC